MKIVEINSVNYGSTGNIMLLIAEKAREKGIEVYTFSSCGNDMKKGIASHNFIGNIISRRLSVELGYYTGLSGHFAYFATRKLLKQIDGIKPDIIHLHNLHSEYINLGLLFKYIKKTNVKVVWTLHDCWSFTGRCAHFEIAKCYKWKTGCSHCKTCNEYPASFIDMSKLMWKHKKKNFTNVKDMTIITPSNWLADLVKQSYLKDYNVKTILNGINLSVFKPYESDFREKMNIGSGKIILLGVSFGWSYGKGLDVFIELHKRLNSDKYQIVLVGTDENVDKILPRSIISIHRTSNQMELAKIYTAADLFVNPTRQEVFGLVNVEANACGTPVLTFNTGGSPETISKKSGVVVKYNDTDSMEKEIIRICEGNIFLEEDCIESAKSYDMNKKAEEYINEYIKILKRD
ncbi:MAG: glycosyltransferase [Firmicutes bacterium]|nr:glycosyltransferase [Bacillota bacterium]